MRKGRVIWLLQTSSGILLLLLVGIHWVVHHYIASGGLREFIDVITYLRIPFVLILEVSFIVVITIHALLGIRAIVLDYGLDAKQQKFVDGSLLILGSITITYGIHLLFFILYT